MKSFIFLAFFILVIYITYEYSYKKFYKDKTIYDIENIILPVDINDKFKPRSLKILYNDLFDKEEMRDKYKRNINNLLK